MHVNLHIKFHYSIKKKSNIGFSLTSMGKLQLVLYFLLSISNFSSLRLGVDKIVGLMGTLQVSLSPANLQRVLNWEAMSSWMCTQVLYTLRL
jgi:hypothetical protein